MEHNKLQSSGRLKYIDTAKAFGICFVIMGHITVFPQSLNIWIFSFHMPLFFFLSGLTFKNQPIKQFLKKQSVSLLLPYALFSLIYVIKDFVSGFVNGDINIKLLLKNLLGILLCIEKTDYIVSGMWFLPCMFISQLFLLLIIRLTKNNPKAIIFVSFGICVAQYVLDRIFNYSLIWCADVALIAMFFIAVGYVFKDKINYLSNNISRKKAVLLISSIVLFALSLAAAAYNFEIHKMPIKFSHGFYGELMLMLAASFCATMFVIILSYITNSKFASFLGQNSLFIYLFHFLMFIGDFDKKLYSFISDFIRIDFAAQCIAGLLFLAVILLVSCPLAYFYKKLFDKLKNKIFK